MLMLLEASLIVSCRKVGVGNPTPINLTINAGSLLIISSNWEENINSINLSFANSNGTLTAVSSDEKTLQILTKEN